MAMYLALDGCIHQVENVVVDTPIEIDLDLKNQRDITFPPEYLSLKCQSHLFLDLVRHKVIEALLLEN